MSIKIKILILTLVTLLAGVSVYFYFNLADKQSLEENIEKRLEIEMEPSEEERDINDPNDMKTLPEPPKPGEQNGQYDYNNPPRDGEDNDPNALKE